MLLFVGKRLSLLLLVFFVWGAAPAFAVDFGAFWQYRESGGDNIETRRSFQQRYSLGAGTGVTWQPTHAISAGFNLSYTRTQSESGTGWRSSEQIVPSANLNLTNDIFRAGLLGTASETRSSSGPGLTSYSWDASLGSNWERIFWPNLWLSYGEAVETSRDSDTLDTHSSRYGFGFDWDLLAAQFFYAYSHNESEDRIELSRSESDSHFVRAETGGNFWRNRLSVRLSQQFQYSESDFTAVIPEEGVFRRRLDLGEPSSATSDPTQEPDPALVQLTINPLLQNNDREGEFGRALSIQPLERGHVGIRFDLSEQIDAFLLYHDPFAPLAPAQVEALRWNLYTRSILDDSWELAAEDLPALYDEQRSRFEVPVGRFAREVKVVVTNDSGVPLHVTELEVISFFTDADGGSRRTSHLTTANMRLQLTRTLAASSSVTYERSDSTSGDLSTESTRRSLSGGLRWAPHRAVSPSLGYSETRLNSTGAPETLARSYSLIVATFPLPTLNVTVGATKSERFVGEQKTATSDTYSLFSTARIYPDLTASLNASYVTSTRFRDDGEAVDIDTFSSRINFNARINPKLTADLATNYRQTETDTATDSSSDSTLSFGYRPSDLLSMRLTGTRRWTGPDTPDTLAFNMSMVLLRTHKTRANFRYSHTQGRETSNRFGLDGSWSISQTFSMQSRVNYTLAEMNSYNFQVSLAMRL